MIDVTHCNIRQLVAKAYELSVPVGMGILHFTPEPLTDTEIDNILFSRSGFISMDYVKGRAVKLDIVPRDGRLFINDKWYDHTEAQFAELCDAIGVKAPA